MATYSLLKVSRLFNHTRSALCQLNSLFINYDFQFRIVRKYLNMNSEMSYSDMINIDQIMKMKKKKVFVPRVTLLSEKDGISIVTLEEAQKIAKRQNLKLVKIVDFDVKSEREIYKLMKIRDYIEADAKVKVNESRTMKEEKTITMSSKISDHDLDTKIKSIHKMLGKRHSVRAVISVDGSKEKTDRVANCILTKSKDIAGVAVKNESRYNVKVILRPDLDEPNNPEPKKNQT